MARRRSVTKDAATHDLDHLRVERSLEQGGLPISGTWPFRSRPCNDMIARWRAFWSIDSRSRFVSQDRRGNENCFHLTR